jgi:UDP-glucose 4-epimerase
MMVPLRVAATGAAGFVAAAVVRRLLSDGHRVLAWLRPGTDAWRLAGLEGAEGRLEIVRLDLGDLKTAEGGARAADLLGNFRPDVFVHAAWQGVRGTTRDDPAQTENVPTGVEVVRLAAAAGAKRFLGLGSQAEYGPHDSAISEETPTRPTTLYGAAKLACGHLSLALARRLGLSAAWARLFSVYGPGERSGALIPDLARALRQGRPFPLGDGKPRWDYLYEDDAAEALARLAVQDDAQGFFNVASGNAVPLREVMLRVGALVAPGVALPIGARPSAPGDLPRLEADVTRLTRATGWRPGTGLEVGLARTVAVI